MEANIQNNKMLKSHKHLIFKLKVYLVFTLVCVIGYFVYDLLKN